MPLPVISNIWRCAFVWSDGAGQRAVNVMHFNDGDETGDPLDLVAALVTNTQAHQFDGISEDCFVQELQITPLDGVGATRIEPLGFGSAWTGAGGADFMPQVACLVKLQTGLRGRSRRGRIFLPFISEGGVTDGHLAGTWATDGPTAWEAWRAAMATAHWELQVASYLDSISTSVTLATLEQFTATQRRRQSRNRS